MRSTAVTVDRDVSPIGYDATSERYVCHWLDVFGSRSSETLGYAPRQADALPFVFEYPDRPFHTTFSARPDDTWHVLMRSKNQEGAWETFAEYTMKRKP